MNFELGNYLVSDNPSCILRAFASSFDFSRSNKSTARKNPAKTPTTATSKKPVTTKFALSLKL